MAEKLWPRPIGSISVSRIRPAGITVSSFSSCVRRKLRAASRPAESCSTRIDVSVGNRSRAGISTQRLVISVDPIVSGAFGVVTRMSPGEIQSGIVSGRDHFEASACGQRKVLAAIPVAAWVSDRSESTL